MSGFDPRISGVESDRSANCATTTALKNLNLSNQEKKTFLVFVQQDVFLVILKIGFAAKEEKRVKIIFLNFPKPFFKNDGLNQSWKVFLANVHRIKT